jgi:hypothetical protein
MAIKPESNLVKILYLLKNPPIDQVPHPSGRRQDRSKEREPSYGGGGEEAAARSKTWLPLYLLV